MWTEIFFKKRKEEKLFIKNTRVRVDMALNQM